MKFKQEINFDGQFILNEKICWTEFRYALSNGWINYDIVRDYALKKLEEVNSTDNEAYLAGLTNENDMDRTLYELCEAEPFKSKDVCKTKWLYLCIKWLFLNQDKDVLLNKLEYLYDFFDYSDDLKYLIKSVYAGRHDNNDIVNVEVRTYIENMDQFFGLITEKI